MLNGLYSAAAGMAAQQERMDVLANDIANVNTTGYKSARIGFRELILNSEGGVRVGAGAALVSLGRSQAQGALVESGDPLNVAIDGPGFFQVRRSDGSLGLTRSGDFRLDQDGSLVTASGDRLVPPVVVPRGVSPSDISISAQGVVSAGGRRLGQLVVCDVPARAGLLPAGDGILLPTAASGAPRALQSAGLRQGFVEGSNVDLGTAMTSVIDAQRNFQLDSRVIQTQDQLMEIANGIRR
jgi:flagellar basal-body rod protein FlgG